MENLNFGFNKLESYFDNVENAINNIDVHNFESCMDRINTNIEKIYSTRNELIENNSIDELRRRSHYMDERVKQILMKFDNIVEKKKTEQREIKEELNELLNKKKLNHYK